MLTSLPKKPRPVVWVVTTHVVTSLFWTILLVFLLGCLLRAFWEPAPRTWPDAIVAVTVSMLATLAATEHSLYFIRSRALIQTPQACIIPSIAVYGGVLAGLLLLPSLTRRSVPDLVTLLVLLGYLICSVMAFGVVTRYRLMQMSVPHTRGFEVQFARPVESLQPQLDKINPSAQDHPKE